MESIDNIMKVRKGYSIKLYEYFNHAQPKLADKVSEIQSVIDTHFEHENKLWTTLQQKKATLEKFNAEIESLSEATGVLDKKRLSEVKLLRGKLETQLTKSESEYQHLLEKIEQFQHATFAELQDILLIGAEGQKILGKLHYAVDKTLVDLKEYCATWKHEPITRLQKIIHDAKKIEDFCTSIMLEIKSLSSLNMDQQYVANLKTSQIPKSCEQLSRDLDHFITNTDYLDIMEKTKETDPFVQDFYTLFKDNGFTSLRTSIRIVSNLGNTEKKVQSVAEHYQHIQLIFQEVLDRLFKKKEELTEICTDANELAKTTCKKWLNSHYPILLNPLEQIQQKRNEFVVNDTMI